MHLLMRKISSLAGCWSSLTQPDAGIHCVLAGNTRRPLCTEWVENMMERKAAADLCLEDKLMHMAFLRWQCFGLWGDDVAGYNRGKV